MYNQRKPTSTNRVFCEDFWSRMISTFPNTPNAPLYNLPTQSSIPTLYIFLCVPLLLLRYFCSFSRGNRGVVVFYGVILLGLTSFLAQK